MNAAASPSGRVIRSMLQHQHLFSVYTKGMHYSLDADVLEIDTTSNDLVIEVEYRGLDFERYMAEGTLSIDVELPGELDYAERETYSLSHLPAKLIKKDSAVYRIACKLPESVFIVESRGGVRIPYILGMQSRVSIDIFLHALSVNGRLRNLSTGGCMVEIDLVESIAIEVGQAIPGITLTFPEGSVFSAAGIVRHVRPMGHHGYAAIGIQFVGLSAAQSEALLYYVNESEREAAHRVGMTGSMVYASPLFMAGSTEKKRQLREMQEKDKRVRQPPMERGVMEVAHRLQVGLMYLKNKNVFPTEIFYDCVDTLLYLVKQNRKAFLYALSSLRDEPDWVRHAIQVAGRLADMLLKRDPHDAHVREALLGTLLHTMGKPLLISASLPSLKGHMNPAQKALLRTHVAQMQQKLAALGWEPGPVCADILENANERSDGQGYPAGKRGKQISALVHLVSVIKAVNTLTSARNGVPARSPFAAYQRIYQQSEAWDRRLMVEYVQMYGLYPIGSLVKYASGFLGWVMDIDKKGKPTVVHLVKNLRFPETTISSVVSRGDLTQVGKLVEIVQPADYGLKVTRL